MSGILRVRWTITPHDFPQPWLACSRCGDLKPFRCSHKFRLNANGRRLDAWMIYRCISCDATWNRPLFERRRRNEIDPLLLEALQTNDPAWIARFAGDAAGLRPHTPRINTSAEVTVSKEMLAGAMQQCRKLEVLFAVVGAASIRTDRLLATELGLSRGQIVALKKAGRLVMVPGNEKGLGRSVRDGSSIFLDLDAGSVAAVIGAATEDR